MNFSNTVVSFINRTDLGGKDKTAGLLSVSCNRLKDTGYLNIPQLEKSGLSRLQIFPQLPEPAGMGEVAGADDIDSFYSTPGSQAGQVARFARSPGKRRMNMQVSYVFHSLSSKFQKLSNRFIFLVLHFMS
jgi:hypothetical protein